MMNIQTPAARSNDPVSSHLAADEMNQSGSRHVQQALVAGYLEDAYRRGVIKRHRGITSRELAAMYGEDRYMIARRLPELVTAKRAVQGPKEESRKCDISGRQCCEWWPSERVMDLIDEGEGMNKFATYEKNGSYETAEFYVDGVLYNLERDASDELSFGNWYAIVKDQYGEYAMKGWLDDSSSYGLYKAYCMAASGCDEEAIPYEELKAILKI